MCSALVISSPAWFSTPHVTSSGGLFNCYHRDVQWPVCDKWQQTFRQNYDNSYEEPLLISCMVCRNMLRILRIYLLHAKLIGFYLLSNATIWWIYIIYYTDNNYMVSSYVCRDSIDQTILTQNSIQYQNPCTHTTHPTQHMPDLVPTSPLTSPLYTAHISRVQLVIKFFHFSTCRWPM